MGVNGHFQLAEAFCKAFQLDRTVYLHHRESFPRRPCVCRDRQTIILQHRRNKFPVYINHIHQPSIFKGSIGVSIFDGERRESDTQISFV